MKVTVNGQPRELDAAATVGTLVDAEVADRRGVAVAIDGEVLPRAEWDATTLEAGARVEVVGAVQGG